MPRYAADIDDDEFENYEFFEEDAYPEIRGILAPEYAGLSPEELEDLFEQSVGIHPEDLEISLNDIGRGLTSVGRLLLCLSTQLLS